MELNNYFLLTSHVLVPPAMKALLQDKETNIDGFLAAGHVCTVMGTNEYLPIVETYDIPIVVTGFEPVDLIQGLYQCISQLEKGEAKLENQYARVVTEDGNQHAKNLINTIFEVTNRSWRGIGVLPSSGLGLNHKFQQYDATLKFELEASKTSTQNGCIAGEIPQRSEKAKGMPSVWFGLFSRKSIGCTNGFIRRSMCCLF